MVMDQQFRPSKGDIGAEGGLGLGHLPIRFAEGSLRRRLGRLTRKYFKMYSPSVEASG